MKKRWWAGYIFIGLAVASCSDKKQTQQQQAPPPVAVNVQPVEEGKAVYYNEYPATVTALDEVEIRPQVSGYITGIYFEDGQHVSKGQKLYSIDQQQYLGSYEQSVANLNVAKANLARAQQDAERYEQLAKQDAIARQTLEHAQADLQAAKMQVEAAQANVSSVQTNLRYSTIYAPLSGTIGISQVKRGAAVSSGQVVLNTISSDDPIAVDFNVDEKEVYHFSNLVRNTPKGDSTFTLRLPDGTIYPYPGRISVVDRAIDPTTGTIRTRVTFSNKSYALRPGMSCIMRVKNSSDSAQILIPNKAVVEQMGEYFVYVLSDSSTVSQRKVMLGQRVSGNIIVKEGLQLNEQIVTDGVQKVRDGAKVQVQKM
ncbi:MAG: efflux RND transporter periplasmic adaptor subunit [Ilyomonas sp.]